jgi:outer membrane receptor for ferrienterochelin and colicins
VQLQARHKNSDDRIVLSDVMLSEIKNTFRYFWCYFILFIPVCTIAQVHHPVKISVLDSVSREPVVAAVVTVAGHGGGFTDTLGNFLVLNRKADARLKIQISRIGYKPWSGELVDSIFDRIILLVPSETALNTVVISAAVKDVSKDLSPIPVEVYTAGFFQKNATPGLFDALTLVNGVRPQTNCNVCGTGDIQINGMPGAYTMITIDGMPIVSGLSTVYGLSGIPNGLIDRVEITKGPAGAFYGSEAVGGVINVITKNALTAPRFFLDAFASSVGETNVDAAAGTRTGNATSLLGINYFRYWNPLDINGDNFTDVTLQNRVSVFNKWAFRRKNNYAASLAARYVYENRWGGEMQWEPRWRGTDSIYGESISTNRMEMLGHFQLPVSARKVLLDASWNLHDQSSVYGNIPYLGRQQVAFAQATTDLPIGEKHEAILGAALRYTLYDDNSPATASPDGMSNLPSKIWLPGVFIQDQISLNGKNRLLLGLRYDYNSAHGNILTPRISWKWVKDVQHSLRVTTGSGYRVANIFTEDHASLTGARTVVIAQSLRPERSWNGNINYTRKFFPAHASVISLDASLFYTYFTNQIIPDYDTDPDLIIYDNLDGHAVSSGGSLNMDFSFLHGFRIVAGVTALNVFRMEQGLRLPQLYAPPFSGTWAVTLPVSRLKLTIDYTGNVNSPMRLPVFPGDYRPEYSPWFSIHNIQFTRELKEGLKLYAAIKNMAGFYPREDVIMRSFDPFDKQVDVDNPNGFTFDPTYNYAPMQRQRLLVGLRWTLNNNVR